MRVAGPARLPAILLAACTLCASSQPPPQKNAAAPHRKTAPPGGQIQLTPDTTQPAAETDPIVIAAQAWIGRALILRGAYLGGDLVFDAAGHPRGSPKTTDWTLAGMDLQTVSRRSSGELLLEGVRVVIGYNQAGHVFERHLQKDEKLRLVLPPAGSTQDVNAEMASVFSQGIDPAFERSLPSYWSHYFLPALPWADELAGQTIIGENGKVPVGLTIPEPEKKPQTELTPEARAAHINGTVQAATAVDTAGVPHRIVLRQPLGWGLDARVADELSRYRFKPGILGNRPVPVEVIFNQTFTAAPR